MLSNIHGIVALLCSCCYDAAGTNGVATLIPTRSCEPTLRFLQMVIPSNECVRCSHCSAVTLSGNREQWLHRHCGSHCVVTVPSRLTDGIGVLLCSWLWCAWVKIMWVWEMVTLNLTCLVIFECMGVTKMKNFQISGKVKPRSKGLRINSTNLIETFAWYHVTGANHFLWNRSLVNIRKYLGSIFLPPPPPHWPIKKKKKKRKEGEERPFHPGANC